jgi:hypothetical protein
MSVRARVCVVMYARDHPMSQVPALVEPGDFVAPGPGAWCVYVRACCV